MIAYSQTTLHHKWIQEETKTAFLSNLISREEYQNSKEKFPVDFYTPNYFIRIGLFLLTLVVASFSFGLLNLLFMSSNFEGTLKVLSLLTGIACYVFLELMVQNKKHYQSGVDDALTWLSAGYLSGSIISIFNTGTTGNCIVIFMISLYFTIRFGDRLMSAVVFLSFAGILFFTFTKAGLPASLLPFVLMVAAAVFYFLTKKLQSLPRFNHYRNCFTLLKITTLLVFYAAGNYYVVSKVSSELFPSLVKADGSIAYGWLFWIFTTVVPVVYIARGAWKKDALLLRVGLLLTAAIVFTVRYYYHLLPVEFIMTAGGLLLLLLSYFLIQYLKQPRNGFTYKELSSENELEKMQLESLVIAETFGKQPAATDGKKFGGGSFGGSGAGSDF